MAGQRDSEWKVLRRCIMLVARLLRGPASRVEMLAIISLDDKDVSQEALEKRFENDKARMRNMGCEFSYSATEDAYTLTSAGIFQEIIDAAKGSPLRIKPDSAIRGHSAETFIRVWQSSNSTEEVSQRLGVTVDYISSRAASLRGKGVPLKKMFKGPMPYDWDALAKLAREWGEED